MKKTIAISALTVLTLLSAGSAFAAPAGCQAKGSMYIVDKGNVIQTLNVTPGAGTTAATSNQGHVGFKTDANGNFNVSFPYVPLTATQTYYFRMEVYNSQYLAYTFAGHPNSFKLTSSPVSGQVVCENPAVPSQKAGIKLTQTAQICQTIPMDMTAPYHPSTKITLPGSPKTVVSVTGNYTVNGVTKPIVDTFNQPKAGPQPGYSGVRFFMLPANSILAPASGALNVSQAGAPNYLTMQGSVITNNYIVPGVSPGLALPASTSASGTMTVCVQ